MGTSEHDARIVLACDTSTQLGSVALLESGAITGEVLFQGTSRDHHSDRVLVLIEDLLRRRALAPHDVTLFVTSLGPGAFTGVRTALATMKGLAWALKRPLAGVCSLFALAWPLFGRGLAVLAALDARKGEVYAALYGPDGATLIEPVVGTAEEVGRIAAQCCPGRFVGVGDGVLAYRARLEEALGGRLSLAEGPLHAIRASVLAYLGTRLDPIPVDQAEPSYLRRPEAEKRFEPDGA